MSIRTLGPVFVLSAERSGSSLLRYILDSHQEIGSPGEIVLGELCQALVRVIVRTQQREDRVISGTAVAEDFARVRVIVSSLMESFLAETGKFVWCDKSPANLQYSKLLASVFPDARFVCLYRSCLDTALSCLNASRFGFMCELARHAARDPQNLVSAMIENWTEKTEALLNFECTARASTYRLKYEDLVCSPESHLRDLFAYLDCEWDPSLLALAFTIPHYPGGGDNKIMGATEIHQRSVGIGKCLPLHSVPTIVLQRAERVGTELGYPAFPQRTKQNS